MSGQAYSSYAEVKQRLDEIVEAVSDDDLALDAALTLYEEAVKLGLVASDLIEQDAREHAADADASALDARLEDEANGAAANAADVAADSAATAQAASQPSSDGAAASTTNA